GGWRGRATRRGFPRAPPCRRPPPYRLAAYLASDKQWPPLQPIRKPGSEVQATPRERVEEASIADAHAGKSRVALERCRAQAIGQQICRNNAEPGEVVGQRGALRQRRRGTSRGGRGLDAVAALAGHPDDSRSQRVGSDDRRPI